MTVSIPSVLVAGVPPASRQTSTFCARFAASRNSFSSSDRLDSPNTSRTSVSLSTSTAWPTGPNGTSIGSSTTPRSDTLPSGENADTKLM